MSSEDKRKGDTTVNATVSGGTNVAIGGRDVSVTSHGAPTAQTQELRELIATLRREIDAHAHEVDDAQALRESAESLENEILQKEQPSAGTIRVMLAGMASAAGQVGSVVDVIAKIQRLVVPMV